MFSCSAHGFWEVLELPVPVTSQLLVHDTPCVRQLEDVIEQLGAPRRARSPTASAPACSCTSWATLVDHSEAVDPMVRHGERRPRRAGQDAGRRASARSRPSSTCGTRPQQAFDRLPATPASTGCVIGAPTPDVADRPRAGPPPVPPRPGRRSGCPLPIGVGRTQLSRIVPWTPRPPSSAATRPPSWTACATAARHRRGRRSPAWPATLRGASATAGSTGCSCRAGYAAEGWRCRGVRLPGHGGPALPGVRRRHGATSTTSSRRPSQEALAQHCRVEILRRQRRPRRPRAHRRLLRY